jgi:hypothetical protein
MLIRDIGDFEDREVGTNPGETLSRSWAYWQPPWIRQI